MKIIEIKALENGAHRNQTGSFKTIPEGFAVVPDDMELENFPFGKLNYRTIDGIKTVVNWEALPVPEVEEITKEEKPTIDERISKIEAVFEKIVERFNVL